MEVESEDDFCEHSAQGSGAQDGKAQEDTGCGLVPIAGRPVLTIGRGVLI